MSYDYSLTADDDGRPVAHRVNCPVVQRHRREGKPIMTMYECEGPLPDYVRSHDCLNASHLQ